MDTFGGMNAKAFCGVKKSAGPNLGFYLKIGFPQKDDI